MNNVDHPGHGKDDVDDYQTPHRLCRDAKHVFDVSLEHELDYRNKKKSVPFPKRSKRSVISENASWRLSDASQYSRFGILMREAGNRNMKMIMTVNPAYRQKKVLRDDHPLGFPAPSKCEAIRSDMSGQ